MADVKPAKAVHATADDPPLSLAEKFRLYLRLALAPPEVLFYIARCVTLALARRVPITHYVRCGLIRFALGSLAPRQLQATLPGTLSLYNRWIRSRPRRALAAQSADPLEAYTAPRLAPRIESLPDGASSILWVGDRDRATKFVYFLHGGGYIAPLLPGHFEWCLRGYVHAAAAHPAEEVAVAVLQYTLAPPAEYPSQLKQAALGLQHLFAQGIRPRDLIIGGDSAGANLTAQVLAHLVHPHPAAVEISMAEPLAGAFLVSPVLSTQSVKWKSFRENGSIDMLSPSVLTTSTKLVFTETYWAEQREGKGMWATPVDKGKDAAVEWLKGTERAAVAMYITVGVQEVLRDEGLEYADAVKKACPGMDLHLEVMNDEAHDWILLEGETKKDGDALRRMREWVGKAFWG